MPVGSSASASSTRARRGTLRGTEPLGLAGLMSAPADVDAAHAQDPVRLVDVTPLEREPLLRPQPRAGGGEQVCVQIRAQSGSFVPKGSWRLSFDRGLGTSMRASAASAVAGQVTTMGRRRNAGERPAHRLGPAQGRSSLTSKPVLKAQRFRWACSDFCHIVDRVPSSAVRPCAQREIPGRAPRAERV
jgi:hypothetical protein